MWPKFLLLVVYIVCVPVMGQAQTVEYFTVQSGTGFFVNRDYLVTNAHVVKDCKQVVVGGGVTAHEAEVVMLDNERDMALIRSSLGVSNFAPLRTDIESLKNGDKVLLVGYPGEKGAAGEVSIAEGTIQQLQFNELGIPWQFYISDVVAQGNSGGPVLDTSGNVIGMVRGMVDVQTYNQLSREVVSSKRMGMAISLRALRHFLENQGVYLQWGGSNLLTYTSSVLEENARRYIVNVQCHIKTAAPAPEATGEAPMEAN